MRTILVTGCGGSAANNFIRSLRMAPENYRIIGVDTSKYYIHLSKADASYIVPPCTDKGYIGALNKIIEDERVDFLHVQPDPEVEVVSMMKPTLNTLTFLPDYTTVKFAQDKKVCNDILADNKVPVPKSWAIHNCPFFEGTKYWLRCKKGAGSLAALPVTSLKQAIMWIDYWQTRGIKHNDFMVSEFLPGKEYAFQSVWKHGELVTSAARERIEYLFQHRMPSGQSSTPTIAMSVHNKEVNQVATDAVLALDRYANGVFCVDLKENEHGVPCVTEVNAGRFFTTSLFFTVAGSNMPYMAVKLGLGERIEKQPQYNAVKEGLYWIRQMDMDAKIVKVEDIK